MKRLAFLALCLVGVACRAESPDRNHSRIPTGGDPSPAPAEPFELALYSQSLVVSSGGTAGLGVVVSRSEGAVDPIEITVDGLPAGVTAAPLTLVDGMSEGTITFFAAAESGPLTTEVVVRAASPRVSHTVPLVLRIPRTRPRGTPDLSFGDAGVAQFAWAILDLQELPDGKLLISDGDQGICRLSQNGKLDTAFGSGGCAAPPILGIGAQFFKITISKNGIIAAGFLPQFEPGTNYFDLFIERFTFDGAVDDSFGLGGWVRFDFAYSDWFNSMLETPDGRLVFTEIAEGFSYRLEAPLEMLLVQLNADGSFDPTFGDNGVVRFSSEWAGDALTGNLVRLRDGRLLVPLYATLRAFNSDGTVDTTFGNIRGGFEWTASQDGPIAIARTDLSVGSLSSSGVMSEAYPPVGEENPIAATGMVSALDGSPIFLGFLTQVSDEYTMALMRRNPDGSIDHAFGTNGIAEVYRGNRAGVRILRDGQIIVFGGSVKRFN